MEFHKIIPKRKHGTIRLANTSCWQAVFDPPRVIYSPDPGYTKEANEAKFQGTCVVSLVVGADGNPHDIKVLTPLGKGLDEKAIDAIKTWKFEPGMKDGEPVATQIAVEVTFHLQ